MDDGYVEEPSAYVGGLQTIDFSNAFNSIRRRIVYDAIATYDPRLLKLFVWAYGSATPVYLTDGSFVCNSESGVRQGDPLGPNLV